MSRAIIVLMLFIGGSLAAFSQPFPQLASFDCAKATTSIERTICADPELAQSDGRMGQAFKLKYAHLGTEQRRALLADQRRWMALRNSQCDVAAYNISARLCILQLTKARVATLEADIAVQAPPTRAPSDVISNERQVASPTPAQPRSEQPDPYADSYANEVVARYRQHRVEFLNTIRNIYFAVGCKVLASEGNALPLIHNMGAVLNQEAIKGGVYFDEKLDGQMRDAAREGMTRASQAAECDYWRQHPDAVYAMRQAAGAAMR